MRDWASIFAWGCGLFFFVAGTVGLVRFRDLYSRLHALTKADNLGLGFVLLGIAIQTDSPWRWFKLGLVWLLVLVSSAAVCQLIAHNAFERDFGGERS